MNSDGDKAIEHFRNAIEIDPQYHLAHMLLGFAYILIGKINAGIRASETAIQFGGRSPNLLGMLGQVYSMSGRIDEARLLLEELYQAAENQYVPPSSIARIYVGLEEADNAFDWLGKAIDMQDSVIIQMIASPWFDPLRSHPRYKALLLKMNLEP